MTASRIGRRVLIGVAVFGGALVFIAGFTTAQADEKGPKDDQKVTLAEAKARAKLLHAVYAATLDSLHHHYFRRERAVLPARAMEDIFADMEQDTKIKARWIAVNTPAMSVNHEPKGEFEKKAADEIGAGKLSYERIENGYYQRAGAIPLGSSCVGCHTRFFAQPPKTPRFAALVLSIPVKGE